MHPKGKANLGLIVLIVLLSGILLTLGAIIGIFVTGNGPEPPDNGLRQGETAKRTDLKSAYTSSKPINDPNRIKETLQQGKTYRVVLKVGIDSRAEDKDWGIKQVTNLSYVGEMAVNRTIEENDGKRVVELRHFETARSVKVLCEVEGVSIELGAPGVLLLAGLEAVAPGTSKTLLIAKPIAEAILGARAQMVAEDAATKAFARVDSLSGKKVRIVYVDGVGVESIEAVAGTLSPDEKELVAASAVLSDYHLFPELEIEVGGTWTVEGKEFTGFIDPSLRGVTSGQVTIKRVSNHTLSGKDYANLTIADGYLSINRSDDATKRVGTFTPSGNIHYSLTNRIVETASLTGDITLEEVSQDHLLFEASHKVQPKVTVSYSCEIQ
jgi:hypothetical protein